MYLTASIFHNAVAKCKPKFQLKPCALTDGKEESDVVKAIPGSIRMGGRDRFDNVIVLDKDEAESTGVQGMFGTS